MGGGSVVWDWSWGISQSCVFAPVLNIIYMRSLNERRIPVSGVACHQYRNDTRLYITLNKSPEAVILEAGQNAVTKW